MRDNARAMHGRLAALTGEQAERTLEQLNRAMGVVEEIDNARGQLRIEEAAVRRAAIADASVVLMSIVDAAGQEVVRVADPAVFPVRKDDRSADPALIESKKTGQIALGAPLTAEDHAFVPAVHPLPNGRFLYLLYSLDGSRFQPYTGTLQLNPKTTPAVYAFADDNAANRSDVAAYSVQTQRQIFVPVTLNAFGG